MNKFKPGQFLIHHNKPDQYDLYFVRSDDDSDQNHTLLYLAQLPRTQNATFFFLDLFNKDELLDAARDHSISKLKTSWIVKYIKIHYANTSQHVLSLHQYIQFLQDIGRPLNQDTKDQLIRLQNKLSRTLGNDANLVPHQGL